MGKSIDFYFDFTSPYGYLASTRIEEIAQRFDREINWHPLVLGFIFKTTGSQPLTQIPLKGDYAIMDIARSARRLNVPYQMPDNFPVGTIAAARTSLWLDTIDQPKNVEFIHAIYKSYFADNIDISEAENVLSVASSIGIDTDQLSSALATPEVKGLLKTAVDDAVTKGIFGSPTICIDGENFWGQDRLPDVEHWLATGGW
ncbi:MAG: 2-hydroxychromene-2-carboxylate isomerase [Granulosicoccus sp.]|nr:2-hydroxychromene-2-carboxylate isomerase [Granulosicoccus sp.]